MASKQQLIDNLDAVVSTLNGRRDSTGQFGMYDYKIHSHSAGLAIDVAKDGEPMNKAMKAALNAGYVVTATYVSSNHTRFFLHEAEEFGLTDQDEARAEGFLAGVFVSSVAQMEDSEPSAAEKRSENGVETAEDAVSWVRARFSNGAAHVSGRSGYDSQPYVSSIVDETPPGWKKDDQAIGAYLVKET